MGAAAVFETAAETPPTIDQLLAIVRPGLKRAIGLSPASSSFHRRRIVLFLVDSHCARGERTQEVDHEAGHAHAVREC